MKSIVLYNETKILAWNRDVTDSAADKCISRVLIANRGEIALRAVKACHGLDLEAVAVYSNADALTPHVGAADRSVCIGPPPSAQSYLCQPSLLHVALETGCDAVYPGYGFLAENADFAEACATNGLKFVGPSTDMIRMMGDKARARRTAVRFDVPVVPGSEDVFHSAGEINPHVWFNEGNAEYFACAVIPGGKSGEKDVEVKEVRAHPWRYKVILQAVRTRKHVSLRTHSLADHAGWLLRSMLGGGNRGGGHRLVAGGSIKIGADAGEEKWREAENKLVATFLKRRGIKLRSQANKLSRIRHLPGSE